METVRICLSLLEIILLMTIYMHLGKMDFRQQLHRKRGLVFGLFIFQMIYTLVLMRIPMPFKSFVAMLYPLALGTFINIKLLDHRRLVTTVNTLTITMFTVICQMISILILTQLNRADLSISSNYLLGKALYLLILGIAYAVLRKSFHRVLMQSTKYLQMQGYMAIIKLLPYAIALIIFVYLITAALYTNDYINFIVHFWWLEMLVIVLIFNSTVNYSKVVLNTKLLENELKFQQEKTQQFESYQIIMEEVKGFWHNYNNIIQVLSMALEADEFVNPILKQTIEEYVDFDMSDIGNNLSLMRIQNPILLAAVTIAYRKAKALDVTLEVTAYENCLIDMNSMELSEVISVLLDNAIEAAFYADRIVHILIDMRHHLELTIENTYRREDGIILKHGHSNKIGLISVQEIVKKYDNVEYWYELNAEHYLAKLIVNVKEPS